MRYQTLTVSSILACLLGMAACAPSGVNQTGSSPSPSSRPSASTNPSPSGTPTPRATPVPSLSEGNLIGNPGAEIAQGSRPAGWTSDSYGELKAEMLWRQDSPFSGQHFLSAQISGYGSEGDAKWFFDPVRLAGGKWYEYRDQYRADGRNRQLYSCTPVGGSRRFYNASQTHATPGWQESMFRFYLPVDCDVTVIHSLDRNGFLHTDHHSLRAVENRPLKEPMVSITFDDIWKTAYTRGAADLDKHGFKGSFYITRLYTETPADSYASLDDVKDLIKRGHELGSHSHRHTALSTMAAPDLIEDTRKITTLLQQLNVPSSGVAYPFGDFDDKVETEIQRYHTYARTSLLGLNDATASRYRLRIVAVTTETTTADLLRWIQAAQDSKTWLILLFHDLGEPAPRNPYTTSYDQYLQILDDLKARNMKVVTVEQGLKEAGL